MCLIDIKGGIRGRATLSNFKVLAARSLFFELAAEANFYKPPKPPIPQEHQAPTIQRSINQSTNQSTNRSINRPINRPTANRSIGQSTANQPQPMALTANSFKNST